MPLTTDWSINFSKYKTFPCSKISVEHLLFSGTEFLNLASYEDGKNTQVPHSSQYLVYLTEHKHSTILRTLSPFGTWVMCRSI